jgi:hypothetical protein
MSATPYSRMLSLGSREGSTPIEDFLTEALAAATNRDPRPLIAALRTQREVAWALVGHARFKVETQVSLPGVGRLDLVLTPSQGSQIWLEVKAYAGEHGNQLENYAREAKRIRPQAKLVLLARPGVAPSIKVPTISWGAIISAVGQCNHPSDLWLELCDLVKEKELGTDLAWPLTKEEALALSSRKVANQSVVRAIAKLGSFATQVEERLRVRFPNHWYANIEKERFLKNQVKSFGRLIYQFEAVQRRARSVSKDPYIMAWAGFEDNSLKVGVEGRGRVDIRKELSHSYGKLEALGWVLEQKNILSSSTRRLGFATEERAIVWVLHKFDEIEKSRAYERIQAASRKHGIDYYDK